MSDVAAEGGRTIVRRGPRWMWATLIVSLSINLLVIGIVLGTVWAIKRGGYWDAPTMIERNFRFMRFLPSERRSEIKAIFHKYKPGLAPYWGEVREARLTIAHLIREGGHSQEELKTAMDAVFQKEIKARQAAMPMISEMLSTLTPAEKMHFLRVFVPYLDEVQSSSDVKIGG